MSDQDQVQTGIRLPKSMMKRLDKIAERMSEPGMPVTRTEVLRRATFLGVEQLEEKLKKGAIK